VVVARADLSLVAGTMSSVLLRPTTAGAVVLASLKAPRLMLVTVSGTGAPNVTKRVTVRPASSASPAKPAGPSGRPTSPNA
jgi:hypothetical protein